MGILAMPWTPMPWDVVLGLNLEDLRRLSTAKYRFHKVRVTEYNWINKARCSLTRPNDDPAFHPFAQSPSTKPNSLTVRPPTQLRLERKCRTHGSITLQTPTTTLATHITAILSTTLIHSIMTLCGTSILVRQTRGLKF